MELIRKDRENEFVNNELVKHAIMQFILMGFDQKVTIKKFEGSSELHWVGDKNLVQYDDAFEKEFQKYSTEYFNSKA